MGLRHTFYPDEDLPGSPSTQSRVVDPARSTHVLSRGLAPGKRTVRPHLRSAPAASGLVVKMLGRKSKVKTNVVMRQTTDQHSQRSMHLVFWSGWKLAK